MVKVIGGGKCSCGNVLDAGTVHHYDGTPCHVITQEDLNHILDGITSSFCEMFYGDEEEK
jgi:hypothetical protein